MKIRLSAICLTLAVFLSVTGAPAYAVEANEQVSATATFVDSVRDKTSGLLAAMEPNKEYYGLGSADFDKLFLGKEIPAYEVSSSGIERLTTIHYFPILSTGNTWVATAIVSYSKYGDMNVEISVKYADNYNSMTSHQSEVALLFDDTCAYLYSDDNSVVAESYAPVEGRISRNLYSDLAIVQTDLIADEVLTTETLTTTNVNTRAAGDVVFLGVPSIVQPTNYTCWAASVASALNYYGDSKTVDDVCEAAGVNQNTYRSTAQSAAVVANYGYGWGKNGNTHTYYYSLTMETLITEAYLNESPIFAGFAAASGGTAGHAVVVQGYVYMPSSDLETMSYMDPGDGYYKASTVPTNGAVTITVSGTTRDFLAGFAVYD